MKKIVFAFLAIGCLLLCSCGSTDFVVATPVPRVGTVVVASAPAVPVVTSPVIIYGTTYPYGYYSRPVYRPVYRRPTPPPPPPRDKRRRRR